MPFKNFDLDFSIRKGSYRTENEKYEQEGPKKGFSDRKFSAEHDSIHPVPISNCFDPQIVHQISRI